MEQALIIYYLKIAHKYKILENITKLWLCKC